MFSWIVRCCLARLKCRGVPSRISSIFIVAKSLTRDAGPKPHIARALHRRATKSKIIYVKNAVFTGFLLENNQSWVQVLDYIFLGSRRATSTIMTIKKVSRNRTNLRNKQTTIFLRKINKVFLSPILENEPLD